MNAPPKCRYCGKKLLLPSIPRSPGATGHTPETDDWKKYLAKCIEEREKARLEGRYGWLGNSSFCGQLHAALWANLIVRAILKREVLIRLPEEPVEEKVSHCGCPIGGPHGVNCPTIFGDIARSKAIKS